MEAGRFQWRERAAGWGCILAGLVHAALVRDHAREWWGYGLFFLLAGLVQLLVGLAVLTRAVTPQDAGRRWRELRRAVLWTGLLTNVGLVAVYALSRTVGVPFFGPEAGQVEAVQWPDLVAKALELLAIVAFLGLLRVQRDEAPPGTLS